MISSMGAYPSIHVPPTEIELVDSVPKTQSGKIKRKVLRERQVEMAGIR